MTVTYATGTPRYYGHAALIRALRRLPPSPYLVEYSLRCKFLELHIVDQPETDWHTQLARDLDDFRSHPNTYQGISVISDSAQWTEYVIGKLQPFDKYNMVEIRTRSKDTQCDVVTFYDNTHPRGLITGSALSIPVDKLTPRIVHDLSIVDGPRFLHILSPTSTASLTLDSVESTSQLIASLLKHQCDLRKLVLPLDIYAHDTAVQLREAVSNLPLCRDLEFLDPVQPPYCDATHRAISIGQIWEEIVELKSLSTLTIPISMLDSPLRIRDLANLKSLEWLLVSPGSSGQSTAAKFLKLCRGWPWGDGDFECLKVLQLGCMDTEDLDEKIRRDLAALFPKAYITEPLMSPLKVCELYTEFLALNGFPE